MKHIFTFDIGNNHPHVGHFQDGKLIELTSLSNFLEEYGTNKTNENFWFIKSSVGHELQDLTHFFDNNSNRVISIEDWKQNQIFRDMPVNYTVQIGEDRLFQAYYLYKNEKKILENYTIVLVDAGTFTTIDFIDQDGFRGGFILPGNQTFLNSYTNSKLLPGLSADFLEKTPLLAAHSLPSNTEQAILGGLKMMIAGIYRFIDESLSEGPLCFIITGGMAKSHWNVIKSMDTSSNLLLSPRVDLIHQSLQYIAQEFLSDSQ